MSCRWQGAEQGDALTNAPLSRALYTQESASIQLVGVRHPGEVCRQWDTLGTLPQDSHLAPPTWCNRAYFQIVKSKKGSEGEGSLRRGGVVLPHGDDFRSSGIRLRRRHCLLRQQEQKAFASLFTALASNAFLPR